ncbi:MAG: hypothetical protein ACLP8S_10045 [Solirubrobacteraceae bacterium]
MSIGAGRSRTRRAVGSEVLGDHVAALTEAGTAAGAGWFDQPAPVLLLCDVD